MNQPQEVHPFGISKKPGSIFTGEGMALVTDFSPHPVPSETAPPAPPQPEQPVVETDPKEGSVQDPADSPEVPSTEPVVLPVPAPAPPPFASQSATEATSKPKASEPSKPTSSPQPRQP